MSTLATRLRRLEGATIWCADAGGDETFSVDICADPPCYWIDGVEVSAEEYRRRVPPDRAFRSFVIDLGDTHDQP